MISGDSLLEGHHTMQPVSRSRLRIESEATRPGRWTIMAFGAILLAALLLRTYGLQRNGWGTEYYSSAVRSMISSGHAFLYGAFDPAGFITIDKPPLAFWVQAASAFAFGFSPASLHWPQVIEGLLSICVVFHLVRRHFGERAALLASLIQALSPIAVAVDRSNNTESCLTLLLLLSVWCFLVATERGRLKPLCLAAAMMGLAFNTKFLAAFVLVPAYVVVYLRFAPCRWTVRLVHLAAAALVLATVSFAWLAAFDLTTPADRPYAAKTLGNTMRELAFSTYGAKILPGASVDVADVAVIPAPRGPGGARSAFYDDEPVGPLRLAAPHLAAQFGWFLPFVTCSLVVFARRRGRDSDASGRAPSRWIWLAWLLSYGAVFSADGGSFHAYYLALLAPPAAMLAAVGAAWLATALRHAAGARWLVLAVLVGTAAWQTYIHSSGVGLGIGTIRQEVADSLVAAAQGNALAFLRLSPMAVLAGVVLCGALLCLPVARRRLDTAALAAATGLLLVLPTIWAMSNVLARGNVMIPAADIALLTGGPRDRRMLYSAGYGVATEDARLIAFLQAEHRGERFILAAPNARLAAPVIVRTGKAAMAIGGFSGLDPAIDAEGIARLVHAGQLRFVLLGGPGSYGRSSYAEARRHAIAVLAHRIGRPVDPLLWRSDETVGAMQPRQGSRMRLWDLRPSAGPAP